MLFLSQSPPQVLRGGVIQRRERSVADAICLFSQRGVNSLSLQMPASGSKRSNTLSRILHGTELPHNAFNWASLTLDGSRNEDFDIPNKCNTSVLFMRRPRLNSQWPPQRPLPCVTHGEMLCLKPAFDPSMSPTKSPSLKGCILISFVMRAKISM